MNTEKAAVVSASVVIGEVRNDAVTKYRRTTFVVVVMFVAALAMASFIMFGFTLHDFLLFDADRSLARREVERLRQAALEHATSNIALGEELAHRKALIASQQQSVEEIVALTSRIAIARHDVRSALDELKEMRETLAAEQGVLASTKKEIAVLEERRQMLNRDISVKITEMEDAESVADSLRKQIAVAGMERESAVAAADMAKKQLEGDARKLTNVVVRLEATRKAQQENEQEVESIKATLAVLMLKVQTEKVSLADYAVAIGEAEQRAEKLKVEIADLVKKKEAMQSTVDMHRVAVADISVAHTNLLVKVYAQRDALVQLEDERDNVREKRDKIAAQMALALEIVKSKNAEKTELDADIAELTGRKQKLEKERTELEKRKLALEAEVNALAKRKAEAAKEFAP